MLDMKRFYGIASILMFIAMFGTIWNLIVVWDGITTGARLSQIAGGVLFNALLFILFAGLWKITPSTTDASKIIESPDLDLIIKKYQGGEDAQKTYNVQEETKPTRKRGKKELHI